MRHVRLTVTLLALTLVLSSGMVLALTLSDASRVVAQAPSADCVTLPAAVPPWAGTSEQNPQVCTATPTPSDTPTPTLTPTNTPTPTPTRSPTPTLTITPTEAATHTPTPTATFTPPAGGQPGASIIGGTYLQDALSFSAPFLGYERDDEQLVEQYMPVGGTASNLYVAVANVGNVVITIAVRKNGVDTSLACTTTAPAGTCSNTTDSVQFSPGDRISLKGLATASSGNQLRWTAKFTPSP